MYKIIFFFKNKSVRYFSLILFTVVGFIIFQAHDTPDDPNVDRMPKELLMQHSIINPPPTQDYVTVYTSSDGYDNFQLGTDNCEPHMSVNTKNPFNFINVFVFVVARNTLDGYDWTTTSTGIPPTISDPWTTCDSLGNLYVINLNTSSGCYITKSTNGGVTWGSLVSIACWDKETIVADQTGGPYANYLYTTVTRSGGSSCEVTRSTNLGTSFSTTAYLTPHNLPGAMVCVGPNGSIQGGCVYVATYSGSNSSGTYTFHRSTNGGVSFTAMSSQSGISYVGTEMSGRSTINGARTRPYPWIAADNSYGPYRGRLYVVWENNDPPGNGNKSDIFLRYSTNQGTSWSSSIRVNDNANPQLTNQWFPAIWCEKETGILYIKWYDMRNDLSNIMTEVYGTYSTNGGVSFAPNQKITNQSWSYPGSGCSAPCYKGDYDMITAGKFGGYATWFDARVGGSQGSFTGYFPDFAMKVNPSTLTSINGNNDSAFSYISIPSVKLYSNRVKFTASVTPTPGTGTITLSFLHKSTSALLDTLSSYPDSLRLRVKTSGGVPNNTYTITVTAMGRVGNQNGTPVHKRTLTLPVITGINPLSNGIPENFHLYQNYPNPFNPSTKIRFDLPKGGYVKLSVFDITGQEIESLINGQLEAGRYDYHFIGTNLASGIYFYKIETQHFTHIKKMLLIK